MLQTIERPQRRRGGVNGSRLICPHESGFSACKMTRGFYISSRCCWTRSRTLFTGPAANPDNTGRGSGRKI